MYQEEAMLYILVLMPDDLWHSQWKPLFGPKIISESVSLGNQGQLPATNFTIWNLSTGFWKRNRKYSNMETSLDKHTSI